MLVHLDHPSSGAVRMARHHGVALMWLAALAAFLVGSCTGLSVGSQHGGTKVGSSSTFVSSKRLLALQHTAGTKMPNGGSNMGAAGKEDKATNGRGAESDELTRLKEENAQLKGLIDSLKTGAVVKKKDATTSLVQAATTTASSEKASSKGMVNERLTKDLQRMLFTAKGISDAKKQQRLSEQKEKATRAAGREVPFADSKRAGSELEAGVPSVVALQKPSVGTGHGPAYFKSKDVTEKAKAHREKMDAEKKLYDAIHGSEGTTSSAESAFATSAKETKVVVKTISRKDEQHVVKSGDPQASSSTSHAQQDAASANEDADDFEATSLR